MTKSCRNKKNNKSRVILLVVSLVLSVVLSSCDESLEKPDLTLTEIMNDEKVQDEEVIDIPPGFSLAYNSKNHIVVMVEDEYNEFGSRERFFDLETGWCEGKIIYYQFAGHKMVGQMQKPVYKAGYLSKDLSLLTEAVFNEAFGFENGVAVVRTESGYGVIGEKGQFVIDCTNEYKPEVSGEFIRIPVEKSDTAVIHKYYDSTGRYTHSIIQEFNDEGVELTRINSDGKREAITSVDGFESEQRIVFTDGESGLKGFKDGFGVTVVKPIFDEAFEYCDGTARIIKDGLYGYVNMSGDLIIEPRFAEAHDFFYGFARVREENLYGYIDKEGQLVIDYKYAKADDFFKDGAAVSRSGSLWGYISTNGKLVLDYKFALPAKFSYGIAPVYDYNERANKYIDGTGQAVFGDLTFNKTGELDEYGVAVAYSMTVRDAKGGAGQEERFYFIIAR